MDDSEALILLGRIEGKLDSLTEAVGRQLKDHEARIRRSEYTLWSTGGLVLALGAKVSWPHVMALFPH